MKILAWEASTGGKSENCLAWEAPIGSIVEHDVFDRFYGDKSVKYRALKETIGQKHETHSKNTGFGGLSRRRCLAI